MNVFFLNLSSHYIHCEEILNLSSENVFLLRIHDISNTVAKCLIFIVGIGHFKINSYLTFSFY